VAEARATWTSEVSDAEFAGDRKQAESATATRPAKAILRRKKEVIVTVPSSCRKLTPTHWKL